MNRGSPPLSTQHLFGLARGIIEQPLGVVEYPVVRLEKIAGDGRAALQQGTQMIVDPSQVVGARLLALKVPRDNPLQVPPPRPAPAPRTAPAPGPSPTLPTPLPHLTD